MSWENPYAEEHRRAVTAQTNREKVLRQKKEREFLRGLQGRFAMESMDEVEAQLEEQNKLKLLDLRQARAASRGSSPRAVPAPPRDPITTVGTLDANLRCFYPTHGGSTIWTGEADGCIGIRSGTDGALAYRIAKSEGKFVDTIFQSTSGHMWVGLSDGTVRIYDPIVFILLFEGKKHDRAVTAFAETFDSKMFSAAVDGSIVKWDSEAHEFECMMELPPLDSAVRSIACYGYNVFVALDSPVIRCFDCETGAETRNYDAGDSDGTVTCLAVIDGYLWSGSADSTISVWTIEDADRVATLDLHRCGVTGLMADDIGHTVWSTDESGAIHVWHSTAERNFAHIRSHEAEPGQAVAVRAIKGFVAVDASKMWSMGGNGRNFVWHSATNRIERSTKQAVLAMEHIIDQDAKELERWSAVLASLKEVAIKLKATMANELGKSTARTDAQRIFLTWQQHAMRRQWRKRQPIAAEGLHQAAEKDLASRYFAAWNDLREQRHRRRHLEHVAGVLSTHHRHEAIVAAFGKARAHYRLMRQRLAARERASALCEATNRGVASNALARWVNFHALRKRNAKRRQMAEALSVAVDRCMLQGFFSAWAGSSRRRQLGKGAVSRAIAVGGVIDRSMMSEYFSRWMQVRHTRRLERRRTKLALIASRRAFRVLLNRMYWKWQRFACARQTARHHARLAEVRSETGALQQKLDAVEHLTGRQRLVEEAQRLIDLTNANIEAKKARLAQIGEETKAVEADAAAKRSGAQEEVQKSISEQVDDLIAMLKAKLINVHQDYTLSHRIMQKCQSVQASKLFLESHAAVKRIVVDLTKQPQLGSEDVWPLSDAKIKAMPKHHAESVLTAIKTMIVTFDIMTPAERHALATDNEIAINAKWLKAFADRCIAMRKKALGKAVFRVKK
mmetsp:Transcript_12434/g.38690  ORF Transcript_12434/g.38690 Transcript_12434/m.38690 type:complete len:904 (-) Transcript_12434:77-2788(-)